MKYASKIINGHRLTIPAYGMKQQKLKIGDVVEFEVLRKIKKVVFTTKIKKKKR